MAGEVASVPRFVDATLAQYADSDRQYIGEAVALDARPASFILRAAGLAIDVLATYAVLALLLWGLFAVSGGLDPAAVTALRVVLTVLMFVIAPMLVETLSHGRSLGRLAVGVRIVRDDGASEQLRHAFVRALTGAVEIYLTFGMVAAIAGLLSPRAKRLGDLLAGTYSQLQRMPAAPRPGLPLPAYLAGWAAVADVAALPPSLSRRIADFLRHAETLTQDARSRVANDLAREASGFVSPLPNTDALSFLVAVAAQRREREYAALMGERSRLLGVHGALTALPPGFPLRTAAPAEG